MLGLRKITILERTDARKDALSRDKAWDIIRAAERVRVGKGKKVQEFFPGSDRKEDILEACLGRTGNLRAPAVRAGKILFVGFNDYRVPLIIS